MHKLSNVQLSVPRADLIDMHLMHVQHYTVQAIALQLVLILHWSPM